MRNGVYFLLVRCTTAHQLTFIPDGEANEGVRVVRGLVVRYDGPTVVVSSQACTVMARQILEDAGHDTV